jgi:hypothetical protein
MHPRSTSLQALAHDACQHTLKSAGVLTFANDSSGSAAPPAPYNAVAERQLACPFSPPSHTLAVQLARRSTLERFFRDHHVRYADVIHQRIHAIKSATPLTTNEGVITPNALLVQALVSQLRVTLQAIEDFDKAIAQRTQSHPDFPLFDALPGAGAVFAPRLLVAFGEQRDRYTSADELQKYAAGATPGEPP